MSQKWKWSYEILLNIQEFLVFTGLIDAKIVYLLRKSNSIWPYEPIAWLWKEQGFW